MTQTVIYLSSITHKTYTFTEYRNLLVQSEILKAKINRILSLEKFPPLHFNRLLRRSEDLEDLVLSMRETVSENEDRLSCRAHQGLTPMRACLDDIEANPEGVHIWDHLLDSDSRPSPATLEDEMIHFEELSSQFVAEQLMEI